MNGVYSIVANFNFILYPDKKLFESFIFIVTFFFLQLEIDTFTTQMGEYTLPMAIHLEDDLCEFAKKKNSLGYLFIQSVNIQTCPPKPVCKYFNY